MEISDPFSAVDSLSGTVIALVEKLLLELLSIESDPLSFFLSPDHPAENLKEQYAKLSVRVRTVKEINAGRRRVAFRKLTKAQRTEVELEQLLLKRLAISLQSDLLWLTSFTIEEPFRVLKKAVFLFSTLIGWRAGDVQISVQNILARLEDDCRKVDEVIAPYKSILDVRMEAGVVAASVDEATAAYKSILGVRMKAGVVAASVAQVLPKYTVAMEERASSLEEQVNSLKDGEVVGIYGTGGIGKTTLAKQVFNNICGQFVYALVVEDVKGIKPRELEKMILEKLEWSASYISRTDLRGKKALFVMDDIESDEQLASVHKSRTDLIDEKTLIVMDDIDSDEQLASVLSIRNALGRGSVVMFTTRDSHLCMERGMKSIVSFEVPFFKEGDARKLFCKHAFEEDDVPEKLSKYVNEVVKKCDGLPLSLEVIGRHLYGQDAKTWERTILKLSSSQGVDGVKQDSLFEILKVIYDALTEEEQHMFCEIAGLSVGQTLDFAPDFAPATMSTSLPDLWCYENLVRRYLVKAANVDLTQHLKFKDFEFEQAWLNPYQTVWMHERLQDLGKEFAKLAYPPGVDPELFKTEREILRGTKKFEKDMHPSLYAASVYGHGKIPECVGNDLKEVSVLKLVPQKSGVHPLLPPQVWTAKSKLQKNATTILKGVFENPIFTGKRLLYRGLSQYGYLLPYLLGRAGSIMSLENEMGLGIDLTDDREVALKYARRNGCLLVYNWSDSGRSLDIHHLTGDEWAATVKGWICLGVDGKAGPPFHGHDLLIGKMSDNYDMVKRCHQAKESSSTHYVARKDYLNRNLLAIIIHAE